MYQYSVNYFALSVYLLNIKYSVYCVYWGLSGGSVVKNPPANAREPGDIGSIPGLGRSPGVVNDNPFQYSCLENLEPGGLQSIGFQRVRHN